MGAAVYLTGVPGAGKSTLIDALRSSTAFDLRVFSYSEHLGEHIGRSRAQLRAESSKVVTASAVEAVDQLLVAFVAEHRSGSLVVIDSHAVTDEAFGQRIIPFHPSVLASISLDLIICLSATPETVHQRVALSPEGRLHRDIEHISTTQRLQEAVAVSYSLQLGIPLYVVDANGDPGATAEVVEQILRRVTSA